MDSVEGNSDLDIDNFISYCDFPIDEKVYEYYHNMSFLHKGKIQINQPISIDIKDYGNLKFSNKTNNNNNNDDNNNIEKLKNYLKHKNKEINKEEEEKEEEEENENKDKMELVKVENNDKLELEVVSDYELNIEEIKKEVQIKKDNFKEKVFDIPSELISFGNESSWLNTNSDKFNNIKKKILKPQQQLKLKKQN
ncbi:hypothetical protein ACTFIR_006829 [Dictyostelium discoideum]